MPAPCQPAVVFPASPAAPVFFPQEQAGVDSVHALAPPPRTMALAPAPVSSGPSTGDYVIGAFAIVLAAAAAFTAARRRT